MINGDRSKLKNLYSKLYKTYPPLFGTGTRLKSFSNDFLEAHKSYIEDDAAVYMRESKKIDITIELNLGKKNFTAYTMDLTQKYIEINADYRS